MKVDLTTGRSLLLRKPPRKQTGLETGRLLFISMSRQAASSTRPSSMHVNLLCRNLVKSFLYDLLFVPDDVGELGSGLGGLMGIFLGW